MKKLLFPVFFSFLLIGCQKETPTPDFEELNIDEVSELNCNPEEENCAFITINIPWAEKNGARNKTINYHIEQHVIELVDFQEEEKFGSLESMSQNFIDNYEASAEEFPEYNIPWEASVNGRIIFQSPELISIEFALALFTGGAHGFTSLSYLNIDPETGEKIQNQEIFTPDFNDYAEKLFREKFEIAGDEPINSTGYFFENDQFQLPRNIGFNKTKVILRYNAYEVASYAEGSIQLVIPREEVEEYIRIF